MRASDVINNVTKIKHESYGVDVQCLTFEALQKQKRKVSTIDTGLLSEVIRKNIPPNLSIYLSIYLLRFLTLPGN